MTRLGGAAKTQPTFLRRINVFASVIKAKSKVSESVVVTLGVRGAVDKESGMIMNLTELDAGSTKYKKWLEEQSFHSRFDFCKKSLTQIRSLFRTVRLSSVHFSFHDFFVHFKDDEIYYGWYLLSELSQAARRWLSPVTITLQSSLGDLPFIGKASEAKLKKKWRSFIFKRNGIVVPSVPRGQSLFSIEIDYLGSTGVTSKIKLHGAELISK